MPGSLALQGVFGLRDGWLKDWKSKPLTGMVGPNLTWKPWSEADGKFYKGIKLGIMIFTAWDHMPKGQDDYWGVGGQAQVGIELPP